MLEEGFYLLFLLRDGNAPKSAGRFKQRVDQFIAHFDKQADNFGKPPELIEHSRYAFCALLDEIVLASGFPLRDEWARDPLQLRLFREHLAGDGFFARLEKLRNDPATNLEALEVFHACLLLGFQGKYLLDGPEKLALLVNGLGNDLQKIRGGKPEFAPNWRRPHDIQNFIRYEMPIWLIATLMATGAAVVFGICRWLLSGHLKGLFPDL
jgi:type VI secretion system protein ImpK